MIRRPDLPLQAAWDEQTATRDVAVLSGQFGAKHYHGLPSKEGDCLEGLAGDALEWDQRSECKLNTTISHPLRDYQKEIKVGSMASVHDMLLSTGTRDNNSRESEILERAQALRRDLRAFIARTSVLDNHIDSKLPPGCTASALKLTSALAPATSGVSNTNGRRRRSYHESRATQSALALSNGSARDEREFRRRRTAEILESGAEQLEREVSPLTVPGGLFDGPVAR